MRDEGLTGFAPPCPPILGVQALEAPWPSASALTSQLLYPQDWGAEGRSHWPTGPIRRSPTRPTRPLAHSLVIHVQLHTERFFHR